MDQANQKYEIIPYLTDSPSFDDLQALLVKLNIEPLQLVRTKEKIWIDHYKGKTMTNDQIIQAMVDNPILIERPIVIKDGKAIIGRDLDRVASFLDSL